MEKKLKIKLKPISQGTVMGGLTLGTLGVLSLFTIIGIIPGLLMMFYGAMMIYRKFDCPNCKTKNAVMNNGKVCTCKGCKKQIYIDWSK